MAPAFFLFLLWRCAPVLNAAQGVAISWVPPEEPVSSYVIHYGAASRAYNTCSNVGLVTSATVTGLADNTRYYFAVTVRGFSGLESDYSPEVSYRTPGPVTVPGAVTNVAIDRLAWSVIPTGWQFILSGPVGSSALVEWSRDPAAAASHWQPLTNVVCQGAALAVTLPAATETRFYRARLISR